MIQDEEETNMIKASCLSLSEAPIPTLSQLAVIKTASLALEIINSLYVPPFFYPNANVIKLHKQAID